MHIRVVLKKEDGEIKIEMKDLKLSLFAAEL